MKITDTSYELIITDSLFFTYKKLMVKAFTHCNSFPLWSFILSLLFYLNQFTFKYDKHQIKSEYPTSRKYDVQRGGVLKTTHKTC